MKRLIMGLMVLSTTLMLVQPAQARLACIAYWDFEECHPDDGSDPPVWCNEWPDAAIVRLADAWNAVVAEPLNAVLAGVDAALAQVLEP